MSKNVIAATVLRRRWRRAAAVALVLLCLCLTAPVVGQPRATAAAPQGRGGTTPGGQELRTTTRQGNTPTWPAEQRPRVHTQGLPSDKIRAAAQHQDAYLYVDWDFGSASGFWNVDQAVSISKKASSTYWAQLWSWTDADYGGYIGLQTSGDRFDGSTGDTAIFSLWNANAASGKACGQFDGEGNGYSCRLPFRIRTKAHYGLRVLRLNADANGQWWGGWVRSFRTRTDYHIGDIRVPSSHTAMGVPSNFSEYFGPAVACRSVPVSKVHWTTPSANRVDDGSYQYGSSYAGFSGGRCTSGSVTPEEDRQTHGMAVRLGGR